MGMRLTQHLVFSLNSPCIHAYMYMYLGGYSCFYIVCIVTVQIVIVNQQQFSGSKDHVSGHVHVVSVSNNVQLKNHVVSIHSTDMLHLEWCLCISVYMLTQFYSVSAVFQTFLLWTPTNIQIMTCAIVGTPDSWLRITCRGCSIHVGHTCIILSHASSN